MQNTFVREMQSELWLCNNCILTLMHLPFATAEAAASIIAKRASSFLFIVVLFCFALLFCSIMFRLTCFTFYEQYTMHIEEMK
jgi:hypothetical protein